MVIFDTAGHFCLDALEPLVGEIERDADERRLVRAAPLVAEIDGRAKPDSLRLELAIQLGHESFDA